MVRSCPCAVKEGRGIECGFVRIYLFVRMYLYQFYCWLMVLVQLRREGGGSSVAWGGKVNYCCCSIAAAALVLLLL